MSAAVYHSTSRSRTRLLTQRGDIFPVPLGSDLLLSTSSAVHLIARPATPEQRIPARFVELHYSDVNDEPQRIQFDHPMTATRWRFADRDWLLVERDAQASTYMFQSILALDVGLDGFFLGNEGLLTSISNEFETDDLLSSFLEGNTGDAAMQAGAVFPILGVPPWLYLIALISPGTTIESCMTHLGLRESAAGFGRLKAPLCLFDGRALRAYSERALPLVAPDFRSSAVRVTLASLRTTGASQPIVLVESVGRVENVSPIINPPNPLDPFD